MVKIVNTLNTSLYRKKITHLQGEQSLVAAVRI
jgi:hypothetical protein